MGSTAFAAGQWQTRVALEVLGTGLCIARLQLLWELLDLFIVFCIIIIVIIMFLSPLRQRHRWTMEIHVIVCAQSATTAGIHGLMTKLSRTPGAHFVHHCWAYRERFVVKCVVR